MSSRSRSYRARQPYGLQHLVKDVALTALTGGLWLIWVVLRPTR